MERGLSSLFFKWIDRGRANGLDLMVSSSDYRISADKKTRHAEKKSFSHGYFAPVSSVNLDSQNPSHLMDKTQDKL